MKRGYPLFVTLVILVAPLSSFGQSHPDLSGVWQLDTSSSTPPVIPEGQRPTGAPAPPPPPVPAQLNITQTASELTVERTMSQASSSAVYRFIYRLDGSDTTNQMNAMAYRSKLSWDGPTLQIASALSVQGNEIGDLHEDVALDGQKLIVRETRHTRAGTIPATWVYLKSK
jgi:hypothetical protein